MINEHPRLAYSTPDGQHTKGDILAINNGGVYVTNQHLLAGSPLITVRLLPEAKTQPIIAPRAQVLHTQAGSTKATNDQLWNYTNRSDVAGEPHVIGPEMDTGAIIQCMPFDRRADSQLKGNRYQIPFDARWHGCVSYETQDDGYRTLNQTPWTFPQLGTICAMLTAVCFTYRIGCNACGAWNDTGIAQHNAFPEWSATAHSCPGTSRTRQMDAVRAEVANRLVKIYTDCGETCGN